MAYILLWRNMVNYFYLVSNSCAGLVELEEGELTGKEIKTESHTLGRMSYGKPPATKKVNEPCHEKTCLQCFQPGLTQTGLYNYRRWLEVRNFEFWKRRDCSTYIAKSKGTVQLHGYPLAHLCFCFWICKICFWICKKQVQCGSNNLHH